LILPEASVRSAGDSALRAAHNFRPCGLVRAPSIDMAFDRDQTFARGRARQRLDGVRQGLRVAVGLDHQQCAGIARQVDAPTSRARRTQSPSMNSSIDGVTGCAISRATAAAAPPTSR
jgi:hypothetical protein